ncbi:MAG: NAD(P)-dependent oxidoreductase [Granulosicoccus sp.]|nr:NAD(P)-dependent oxidoreductase [Granulosicoccus sp.]
MNFRKLVLTGAAGRLGSYLREPLSNMCEELVSTDLVDDIGTLYPGERYQKADLAKLDEVTPLLENADQVVHFGAIGDEAPFDDILQSNIIGAYNVWEAARVHKVRRVVYASSIHAVGMHTRDSFIDTDVPHRPDTFYGLAKCFAEDLGSLYWDKFKIEAVCLRILSCAKVNNARALGSWLSYDDLIQLVERAVDTPTTRYTIIYGVSNNDRTPVDNSKASFLGYRPKDNAEQFASEVLQAEEQQDLEDATFQYHGGPFAAVEPGQSGQALMNIIDDKKETAS